MPDPITLEIWSDVQCPFCYIGKRQLERALESFEHRDRVELVWRSFQLDPTMKSGTGEKIEAYLSRRKGLPLERVAAMHDHVNQMAGAVGLRYDFARMVVANSAVAHRLIQYGKTAGLADAVEETLFEAYFTQGADLGDDAVLEALAIKAGVDAGVAREVIADADGRWAALVAADVREAQELGTQGVPFFVFDRRFAVSGAQGEDTLLRALRKAATA